MTFVRNRARLACPNTDTSIGKNSQDLDREDVRRLIEDVAAIGDSTSSLVERRHFLLKSLTEIIDADLGYWAWGRGHMRNDNVTPIALLDVGFSLEQKGILAELSVNRLNNRDFRPRIIGRLNYERQATALRYEMFTPEEWSSSLFGECMARMGMDTWICSVRYCSDDTWIQFGFLRKIGREEFTTRESTAVDFAAASIRWFHVLAEERLPPTAFVDLTDRQRAVMLMLLDGQTRKQISFCLKITENTVGDHIKAIYRHFGVGTATELAAVILRGQ